MKKLPILILVFIMIISFCIPAFAFDFIPVNPINPIIIIPLIPSFADSKDVYTVPLYMLYSSAFNKHTYTASETEKNNLISNGWDYIEIVGYVSPVLIKDYIPLYRYTYISSVTRLSTYSSLATDGCITHGIIGYIPPSASNVSTLVYESVRELGEDDFFWLTDYYYCDNYITIGPYVKPNSPHGYTWTEMHLFDMWLNNTKLQEISINPIPSNLIGESTYNIEWSSMLDGYVKLMYSTDNGSTWATIGDIHLSQTGGYVWTVPNITSNEVKVRAFWRPYIMGSDYAWGTSNTFSITMNPEFNSFIPFEPPVDLFALQPATPSNLASSPDTLLTQITLYWTDNSSNETGFSIERKPEGGIYAEIGTSDIDATTYVDTSISEDIIYTYRVKATGTIINSGYSNEIEGVCSSESPEDFVVPDPPNAPTNVEAVFTDGSESEILISWDDPTGDYTGFKVERNTDSVWESIGTTIEDDYNFIDVDLFGLDGEISYRVKSYDGPYTSDSSNIATITVSSDVSALLDGSQSGWAESEIIDAFHNNLTFSGLMNNYGQEITREEFCIIAVKLYKNLSGNVVTPDVDPFDDTDNPDILKAYKLGIVYGISATEFAPYNNITRQEMSVMIYRALDVAGYNTAIDTLAAFPFTDEPTIASWAINAVKFCNQNGIMSGMSPTTIAPLLNTPREQAIALINRTYISFK
ncbi:MAG: S-layer homology domain-containing protein [Clostridiales bacterium]|nr:S-layer homology domain-containing protein [Clostridiales bacterium]